MREVHSPVLELEEAHHRDVSYRRAMELLTGLNLPISRVEAYWFELPGLQNYPEEERETILQRISSANGMLSKVEPLLLKNIKDLIGKRNQGVSTSLDEYISFILNHEENEFKKENIAFFKELLTKLS